MTELKTGDVVKFDQSGKTIRLWLQKTPSNARALNGVSEEDEILISGFVVTKTRGLDGRKKGKKAPYIVKRSEIEVIDHWEV